MRRRARQNLRHKIVKKIIKILFWIYLAGVLFLGLQRYQAMTPPRKWSVLFKAALLWPLGIFQYT
jgi:hypothetical protein